MSRVQRLRVFVSQRLNAAVEEILEVLEKTVVTYEQEAALCQEVISRQHALLCALHKPLEEPPSADASAQQLLVSNQEVPPEHQDQDPEQLQHLDEADIIQFTYNPRRAARPGEEADPGAAGPDQDVQLVSSETEDSDDYGKDSTGPRPASKRPKPKRGRRPRGALRCRVCGRTFTARRFFLRHVKAHSQEAEPAAEDLQLHVHAHRATPRRELENQTSTRSRGRPFHQHLQLGTKAKVHASEKPLTCSDCGRTFLQVQKKKRHRCRPWKDQEGSTPKKKKT